MTGDATLLRRDYRRQLGRFLDGAKRRVGPWRIPNLGPSYSFHRNPFQRAGAKHNIESNEYANIVLDVIYYYEQARREGMTPLSACSGADASRLGQASAARLLDPQRLPQLGHGPLPVSLAPLALLGLVLPGTARDRDLAELRGRRASDCGGSTSSTVRWPSTSGSRERWDDDRREPGSQPLRHHDEVLARAGTSSSPASRRWQRRRCCADWGTSLPRSRRRSTRSIRRSAG